MRQESATWVDISALGKVEQNHGRAERDRKHVSIGTPSGRSGMEAIADALWTAIKRVLRR